MFTYASGLVLPDFTHLIGFTQRPSADAGIIALRLGSIASLTVGTLRVAPTASGYGGVLGANITGGVGPAGHLGAAYIALRARTLRSVCHGLAECALAARPPHCAGVLTLSTYTCLSGRAVCVKRALSI